MPLSKTQERRFGLPDMTNFDGTFDEYSDEELLALSQQNPDVFAVLLGRYQPAFLRKAYSIVKNWEDAEDITQEAFTKIYLYGARFEAKDGAQFSSWGYKIVVNTALTHYQKNKRKLGGEVALEPELYELLADTESGQFEKAEVRDIVVKVMLKMSESCAKMLRMFYLEGLSHKEMAEKEHTTVGAIKTRVHRAKIEFRNVLDATLPR